MRAVVQRVQRAAVRIADQTVAAIGSGLCVLVGISTADGPGEASALAHKVAHLRIFGDEQGKLNRSVLDVGGSVLVVSQFTLYGDTSRGRRPSFVHAAPPEQAEPLCDHFVAALRHYGLHVATGRFRATMLVEILNDGPVTLILDSDA